MKASKINIIASVIAISISIFALNSCKKSNTTSSTVDCSTISALYSTDVSPIITASCSGSSCHGTNSYRNLMTYSTLKAYVNNGTFKSTVITNKSMPQGSSLSQSQLNTLICWLDAGAQNN